jgi:D-beta-D-heptose 7-phosphate kinase/D-beta-D-heptose 1-phosphate adenosyltransferase
MRYPDKVVGAEALAGIATAARDTGQRVVFTNGCFDLLHVGHVRSLATARAAGDLLVVGLNSDASVQRLKGPSRPLVAEDARAEVLAALESVSYVTVFDDDTPARLIALVQPDVLVKGGDWAPEDVVGREVVEARGGRVLIVPLADGFSTTDLLARAQRRS